MSEKREHKHTGTEDDPIPLKEGEIPDSLEFNMPEGFKAVPKATMIINPRFNDKGIVVARRIHPMYSIDEAIGQSPFFERLGLPALFGKYQYFYESPKGVIDMITQPPGLYGPNYPEIFEICSDGKFFEGPEKYTSREEAEKRIEELLAIK